MINAIENHFETNLNELKKNFFYSKLSKEINDVSSSIIGNNLEMRLVKKVTVTKDVLPDMNQSITIKFYPCR